MGVCDCGQCFCNSGRTGALCNEVQGGESALCTDRSVEQCVLCLRQEMLGKDESKISEDAEKRTPNSPPVTVTSEAAASCQSVCNVTVIDTPNVQIIDEVSEESGAGKEESGDGGASGTGSTGSNLCIIYTEDSCRVMFKYRYSDAVYINRKVGYPLNSNLSSVVLFSYRFVFPISGGSEDSSQERMYQDDGYSLHHSRGYRGHRIGRADSPTHLQASYHH